MNKETMLLNAAKALGSLLYIKDMDSWIHVDADGNRGNWWNPLESSADCAEMEDALSISIVQAKTYAAAFSFAPTNIGQQIARYKDHANKGAARRYASTMVAHMIGSKM